MNDATIFSKYYQVVFNEPATKTEIEAILKKILDLIGRPLSRNGIILGHIKLLAKLNSEEEFLFLSLTRLDRIDVKASAQWSCADTRGIDSIRLNVNVLVFGHSMSDIVEVVNKASQEFLSGGLEIKPVVNRPKVRKNLKTMKALKLKHSTAEK
ncbi:hypothetical protein SCACP_27040 [Sporomusa carbonis]|uniref:hypothetical protein n=1 Tax=Sporomusa carbonis TaxID=3076075 RepID=UPI003A696F51